MNSPNANPQNVKPSNDHISLTGSHRRTLDAVFRHPSAHNLEWTDLVSLIGKIGEVVERTNSEFEFNVSGERHLMRKPHSKDLTGPEVIQIRHFLKEAGWSTKAQPDAAPIPETGAPSLMVVVDHHEAKIYEIDVNADDASVREIKPYDPHHFLHHLTHKGQSRERGQRAPEDPSFYERIAQALRGGSRIIVVGHGTGKSNAAHLLIDHLRSHEHALSERIVSEVVADLSSTTVPQLLEIAEKALH